MDFAGIKFHEFAPNLHIADLNFCEKRKKKLSSNVKITVFRIFTLIVKMSTSESPSDEEKMYVGKKAKERTSKRAF